VETVNYLILTLTQNTVILCNSICQQFPTVSIEWAHLFLVDVKCHGFLKKKRFPGCFNLWILKLLYIT